MDKVWIIIFGIVQSLVVGVGLYLITHKMNKSDKKRELKEDDREANQILIIRSTCASLDLGITTAEAIKNGKANGTMERALEKATVVRDDTQKFMEEQRVKSCR